MTEKKYTKTEFENDLKKLNKLLNKLNDQSGGASCSDKFDVARDYMNPNPQTMNNPMTNAQALNRSQSGGKVKKSRSKSKSKKHGSRKHRGGASIGYGLKPEVLDNGLRYEAVKSYDSCGSNLVKQNGGNGYTTQPVVLDNGLRFMAEKPYGPCGAPVLNQTGGDILSPIISTLSNLLAPMGVESLATVAVLLALNEIGKPSKKKKMTGGELATMTSTLAQTLIPMGQNQLLTLVSLLILNYFAHIYYKKPRAQRGGSLEHLATLLAPMGTNALTSTAILLFLSQVFNQKRRVMKGKSLKRKSMKGGNPVLVQLESLLAPMGIEAFSVAALLLVLNKLFVSSLRNKKSSQKGGSVIASMLNELSVLLAPQGLNAFLTTAAVLAISQVREKNLKKPKMVVEKVSSFGKKTLSKTKSVVSSKVQKLKSKLKSKKSKK